MMSFFKNLAWAVLNETGAIYDPEYWVLQPPQAVKVEKKKRKAPAPKPENIVTTKMGATKVTEHVTDDSKTLEWDRVTTNSGRTDTLTPEDEIQLSVKGIDLSTPKAMERAAILKMDFAAGLTENQIVDKYKDKKGYGRTTVKAHLSAFHQTLKATQNG